MESLVVGAVIAVSWAFNLYSWLHGFGRAFKFIGKKNIMKSLGEFIYTFADMSAVGVIRFLVGTYAAAMLPSAILAILVSLYIMLLRHGKIKSPSA